MELENPGSALGTMDHARRGVKRGHDVPALHLLQGRDVVRRRSGNSSRLVRGRSLCAAGSRNRFTGATRGGRQGDQIWIDFQDRSLAEHNRTRSEEHTSELQSPCNLVCRLLLEKKKKIKNKVSKNTQQHKTGT